MLLLAVLVSSFAVTAHFAGYDAQAYTSATAAIFPVDISCMDLKLRGDDILDSNGTTRITVGATTTVTGNLSVTGSSNPTYFVPPTADVTVSSPTAFGQVVKTSAGVLYISTNSANVITSWVKVGAQ
jgi:hypothetical protein